MPDTRHQVATVDDLDDGEMMQVTVEDLDLVLARLDGEYFATGGHCSHYGAPLAEGVLEEETGCLICPWHHAVFQIATGEQKEPPARNDLTQFDVTVEEGDIYVEVPEGATIQHPPDFCQYDPSNRRHFVIVGGGAAGSMALETLRRHDFDGRISMITADTDLPYDRPKLSKSYLAGESGEEALPMREPSVYDDLAVDIHRKTHVDELMPEDGAIVLGDGTELDYDKLLLATGGRPRHLDVPGADLDRVHLLRSRVDCDAIIDDLGESANVVVIGSSFIGMESAASMRSRDLDVTVASIENEPFERTFGRAVGRSFRHIHEENGVQFALDRGVERIEGNDAVEGVLLDDGTELEADLVLVGVGVRPATSFVDGLEQNGAGAIEVDRFLRADDDIYAAGDIARFPDPRTFRRVRIEHWRLAQQHGQIAARNMLGHETPYDEVPFFWTRQYGTSYKYVGHADQFEDVIIDGDLGSGDYIAYYVDGDDVLAALGTRGHALAHIHGLMRHDEMPTTDELLGGFEIS